MGLTTEQIVKLLQLKSLGRKTAFKLCEISKNQVIDNDYDLKEFLLGCIAQNKVQRLPFYTKEDLSNAFNQGLTILSKSDRAGITVLSVFDELFPSDLKEIHDSPIIINVKGNYRELNSRPGVAIIGTREPTEEGRKMGRFLGKYFGELKFNVVSGLAKGCDSAAHWGCLDGTGMTTAIVAHRLHTVYPKENEELASKIIENGGVLLSEYFIGVGALANFFVERDRLQAGLANGTIIIQSGVKGGTMHAVRATIESQKPLAAVSYNVNISYDKIGGNETLIREHKADALTRETIDKFVHKIGGKTIGNTYQPTSEVNNEQPKNQVEKVQPIKEESMFHEPPDDVFVEPPDDVYHEHEETMFPEYNADSLEENIQKPINSDTTINWGKRKIAKPKKYSPKGVGGKRRVSKKNNRDEK
jgi:DNA processing protein